MFPILLTIGEFEVDSYYVLYVIGVIVGVIIGWRVARSLGYGNKRILLYFSILIPLALAAGLINGMLFSRLFYVSFQYGQLILGGGIVSYGVVLTAFAVTAIFSRVYCTPVASDLDGTALVLPIMLAIFRIGCFLNGCCYGRVTDGLGGIYLPNIYGEWALRYPTQILLLVLDIALALGLWLRWRKSSSGDLVVAFVFWFGLGRLAIDSLRNLPAVVGPFSLHVIADSLFVLAGVGLMIWRRLKSRKG